MMLACVYYDWVHMGYRFGLEGGDCQLARKLYNMQLTRFPDGCA